jgi:hypothetical protein
MPLWHSHSWLCAFRTLVGLRPSCPICRRRLPQKLSPHPTRHLRFVHPGWRYWTERASRRFIFRIRPCEASACGCEKSLCSSLRRPSLCLLCLFLPPIPIGLSQSCGKCTFVWRGAARRTRNKRCLRPRPLEIEIPRGAPPESKPHPPASLIVDRLLP